MYHSVTFNPCEAMPDFSLCNTYDDFHLIPTKRPSFDAPEIDAYLTMELEHRPLKYPSLNYSAEKLKRSASWNFIVENGYNWVQIYSDILYKLHGRVCYIWLEDDPNFYYKGRVRIGDWSSEDHYSTIAIYVDAEPYKEADEGISEEFSTSSKTISVNSDFIVPVDLYLLPSTGVANLRITGLARNRITGAPEAIEIDQLDAGQEVIISGTEKKILLDHQYSSTLLSRVHLWSFPSLEPGSNIISIGSNNIQTTVIYRPRYL